MGLTKPFWLKTILGRKFLHYLFRRSRFLSVTVSIPRPPRPPREVGKAAPQRDANDFLTGGNVQPLGRTFPVKDIPQSSIPAVADVVEVAEDREGQGCQIPRLMNAKLAIGGIEVEAKEDGHGCELREIVHGGVLTVAV